VGEAVFFGLDSKLTVMIPLSRLPLEPLGLSFSYQYLLSYLLSYGYTFASDKRIPYMPQHTLGFSLTMPWKNGFRGYGGSLAFSGHYEGPRYADTSNLTRLKSYFLLNASVNQGIGKNLAVFGVLRNILNRSYESFNDYYMPGLTITLGMRVNFSPASSGR
jgi:vitamin B12 transporter